jgi:hypothetical protein
MATVSIAKFEDTLVLYFETEGHRVNAYTLATTLVAVADAAKAANAAINAGHEIEIVVEALSAGSFKATLKAIYKSRPGVLSTKLAGAIVVGLLTNFIYEKIFQDDPRVTITINTSEVIVQDGNDRYVIPREIYDATRQAEKNPEFPKAVGRVFDAISRDPEIQGMRLLPSDSAATSAPMISIERLRAAALKPIELPNVRVVPEIVNLQILKAILERSKRKWEFMWRGFKISAPITDELFYINFFAHDITIAPGDVLSVTLHVFQELDQRSGVYKNVRYEVVQVHDHIPRIRQPYLEENG